MKSNILSDSELDLLSKYNIQNNSDNLNKTTNHILPKLVEHIFNNYQKLNQDNKIITQKNDLLYKQIEYIININNRLLFHFQLALLLIIIIIILHLYYVF